MAETGLALQLFMSGDDDIIVKEGWRPHPGQPMPQMAGVFIGKQFGAGALAFNTIFDLVDEHGKTTDQALKVCRPTLAARRSLAHEWKMFKDLSLLADQFEAARSHFLQAHRVMRLADGRIAGIVMEKANGHNVDKTLNDPNFCNVRYVISLLRDLLVGLDVAQRVLGFTHYDLKLDNVMEHWNGDPEAGKARLLVDAVPQFKIFDFGTAVVYPDPFSLHTAVDEDLQEHRPDAAPYLAEQTAHNRRGKITQGKSDKHTYEYSTPFCCVRIYHMWGKRKGDVFRVLSALCRHLDDRTWPLEDLELVSLLFTVLEHATNSKRLKAKFEPRSVLLHRLYGPNPPPVAPATSLSRAQTQAILQQHSQLVLQGSSSMRVGSQGGTALPSAASIEAYGRQQQKQQKQAHLQGVAEGEGEGEEQQQQPFARTPLQAAPLRINTTKFPTTGSSAATGTNAIDTFSSPAAATAAVGGSGDRGHMPPPSPTGGGQYTPRRSTEVSREEFNNSAVPGMRYVRLAKAADSPPSAAAGAAGMSQVVVPQTGGTGFGTPAATTAPAGGMVGTGPEPASSPAPPSPFAGYGHGGTAPFGSSGGSNGRTVAAGGSSAAVAAVPGVQQMVSQRQGNSSRTSYESGAQRTQQPQQQQQQQNGQQVSRSSAVAAATKAAAEVPVHPESFVVAAAPAGLHDPFAPENDGSNTGSYRTHHTPQHETSPDPNRPQKQDSAGTIVAKQPLAPAEQQSVLGSRKALRGVTAQQLLVEPIVQSLLSKV